MRRFRALTTRSVVATLLTAVVLVGSPTNASALTPTTTGMSQSTTMVLAAYHDFYGRAPTNAELSAGTAYPLSGSSGRLTFVTTLAHSSEWISTTVDQLYRNTLGRPGDQPGMTYWIGMLSSSRLTVAQVAAQMYSSDEYFAGFGHSSLTVWVTDLYTKILGRPTDSGGLNYWVGQAQVSGRYKVAYAFYQSIESRSKRVTDLYSTLLDRSPDPGGLAFWAAQIAVTGDLALASNLAASDEYWQNAYSLLNDWIAVDANASGLLAGTGSFKRTQLFVGTHRVGFGRYCTGSCTSWGRLIVPADLSTIRVVDVTATGAITGVGYSVNDSKAGQLPSRTVWLRWATPTSNPTETELTTASGSAPIDVRFSNDAGAVVGSVLQGPFGPNGPWLYWPSPSSLPQSVTLPTGFSSVEVTGLLPNGSLVGWGLDQNASPRGIVWSTPSNPQVAALPTGFTDARITGTTPTGTLIGCGTTGSGTREGVVWSSPSSATALPSPLAAHVAVTVNSGNASGVFVGTMTTASGGVFSTQGVVWSTVSATPTILTTPAGFTGTAARSINASGTVVGVAYRPNGTGVGMTWTGPGRTPTVLTSGLPDVDVDGITAPGVVYGKSTAGDHGAIWS